MTESLIRGVSLAAVVALALGLGAMRAAYSDGHREAHALHGRLDGMSFVGTFGPAGEPSDRDDTLYFGDGQFWSANCVPCGFRPGIYWVRMEGDTIHFRGEMQSGERGRFVYTGVVRDGQLSATINWRKERWYWSIDRDFRFEGKLAETPMILSAAKVAHIAEVEGALPKPKSICPL